MKCPRDRQVRSEFRHSTAVDHPKLYAIGLLPLTRKLKESSDFVKNEWKFVETDYDLQIDIDNKPSWKQWWYADDS